jgi:hypothetical protein
MSRAGAGRRVSQLRALEAEAVHVVREVVAEPERPGGRSPRASVLVY